MAGSPYAIIASSAVGSGLCQLHDHLRQRQPDGDAGSADDHGRQHDQDLRADRRRSPAPTSRRAAWSTATRCRSVSENSTGTAATADGGRLAVRDHRLERRRLRTCQLHDHLRQRQLDGEPGSADDHGQQRDQDLRANRDACQHRVHDERSGQQRLGGQREREQHGRGGDRDRGRIALRDYRLDAPSVPDLPTTRSPMPTAT